MYNKYNHLSVHQCEIEAICCKCDTINVIKIGDPFEVHNMIERYYNGMINDGWHHDHGGHWFCPNCKELI